MKKSIRLILLCFISSITYYCSPSKDLSKDTKILEETKNTLKILSLGDSYTIGQSVCETCRFPVQLKNRLEKSENKNLISLKIIAQTGWTTSALKNAIKASNTSTDQDLVTLLIGVNNQFQNRSFSIFEKEFPELVNTSIKLAQGDKKRLIVISIPDYAFTPFGNSNTSISAGITKYNNYIEAYCKQNNIDFIYITDITKNGLIDTELVASDGLHPSKKAYSQFVDRLLPLANEKLKL